MEHVLTLVAGSRASPLTEGRVTELRHRLAALGLDSQAPFWLDPNRAVDLPLWVDDPELARHSIDQSLGDAKIDTALQLKEGRRKALLLADMESTIIGQEMIDEIAEAAKLGPEIAEITRRAMAGELAFASALRERVARFAGLPAQLLKDISSRMTLNPGARVLVQTMRHHGAYCALVSGGFSCFTAQVRAACGFHEDRANELILEDGKISGRVQEPILGPEAKRQALAELTAARGLAAVQVCAVGDGANDLAMLAEAGLGVAYHGKPAVRAAAPYRIDHGDLSSLLSFQGFHRDELQHSPIP